MPTLPLEFMVMLGVARPEPRKKAIPPDFPERIADVVGSEPS